MAKLDPSITQDDVFQTFPEVKKKMRHFLYLSDQYFQAWADYRDYCTQHPNTDKGLRMWENLKKLQKEKIQEGNRVLPFYFEAQEKLKTAMNSSSSKSES